MERRYNEELRHWQNLFAITTFPYIEVLPIYFTTTWVKKIVTVRFVISRFHCTFNSIKACASGWHVSLKNAFAEALFFPRSPTLDHNTLASFCLCQTEERRFEYEKQDKVHRETNTMIPPEILAMSMTMKIRINTRKYLVLHHFSILFSQHNQQIFVFFV